MAPSNEEQQRVVAAAASEPIRRRRQKYRSMREIMRVTKPVELTVETHIEKRICIIGGGDKKMDYYSGVRCEECGSEEREEEMLLCDKCDRGHHMLCLRPIITRIPIGSWFCADCSGHDRLHIPLKYLKERSINDFFNIPKCLELNPQKCHSPSPSPRDAKKRRKRCATKLVIHKKQRRLLAYIPSEDPQRRIAQMESLATALTAKGMEFANELIYDMAPRSANQAIFENGGVQILSKEDTKTLERCEAMYRRGEYPPLIVTFDSCQGYTVEADGPIKDFTLLGEFTGEVDFMTNREYEDSDSMMTLLLATDRTKSLVICADRRANIVRFFSGINNHTPEGRKKQNTKCLRYNVNGECRVLVVVTRNIAKGEKLYFDYNGHENEYPTHNFV